MPAFTCPRGRPPVHDSALRGRFFFGRLSLSENDRTPLAKCSGREGGKARGAGWGERAGDQPGCEAIEVEGRGGRHALQARLGEPAVARLAQTKRTHALRDRTLDTLALGVELAAGLAVQACPSGRDRLVLWACVQRKPAADSLRATRSRRARPAMGRAEASPDEGAARGF